MSHSRMFQKAVDCYIRFIADWMLYSIIPTNQDFFIIQVYDDHEKGDRARYEIDTTSIPSFIGYDLVERIFQCGDLTILLSRLNDKRTSLIVSS